MNRSAALLKIADAIDKLPKDRPLRIAVNGRIASGKTALACELANELKQKKCCVWQVGVDAFHNPRAVRYRQGRNSSRGYYEDAYDLDALRRVLLEPLGKPPMNSGNTWQVRTATLDLDMDTPIDTPFEVMNAGDIVIVDGSFLLVPKLRMMWDYVIFIDVARDIGAERGAIRDAAKLDGVEESRRLHDERYQAACDIYLEENEPQKIADVVFDNSIFENPTLRFVPETKPV